MDDIQLAGTLATIAANQLNQTKALEGLSIEIREARDAGATATADMQQALGSIVTDVATTKSDVANHKQADAERFEMLWRAIKWGAGVIVTGGVAGGAKIATALL